MNGPLEELQFTDEEIDHGVKALVGQMRQFTDLDGRWVATSEAVRAVLRAVRAVPARCLNGGLAGHPATPGAKVQGTGLAGVRVRGTVVYSYPVTTAVRTPGNGVEFIWTNTISSWDPSTDTANTEFVIGPPTTGKYRTLAELDYLRADDDGMPCEEGR